MSPKRRAGGESTRRAQRGRSPACALRATGICAALAALIVSSAAVAAGDAGRGRTLYESRCIACHSIDANRIGPAHRDVYGRKAGGAAGYDYSPALKASAVVWDDATLDRWLADPDAVIPGQKMGYAVPDTADRADLIAYLKSQSSR